MASPYQHIDDLINEADERDLVSQLTPDRETGFKNESRANELRDRIATLKARIARLTRDHPEK